MYDLEHDPIELINLAHGDNRTEKQEKEYVRLRAKLAEVEKTLLQPLPQATALTLVHRNKGCVES